MNFGDLRHRLRIEEQPDPPTRNEYGEIITPWALVIEVWGKVDPLTGAEAIQNARVEASVSHRVTIRHRTGIKPSMRVVWGERVFTVQAVLEENKPTQLVLACQEVIQ